MTERGDHTDWDAILADMAQRQKVERLEAFGMASLERPSAAGDDVPSLRQERGPTYWRSTGRRYDTDNDDPYDYDTDDLYGDTA